MQSTISWFQRTCVLLIIQSFALLVSCSSAEMPISSNATVLEKNSPVTAPSSTPKILSSGISKEQQLDFLLIELSLKEHLPLEFLRDAFKDVRPQTTAKQLIAPPSGPTAKKNWTKYRANVMDPSRLNAGRYFLSQYRDYLNQLEKSSGVPVAVIVGILGVETIYGRMMGTFPVRDVLTTLAFDYPSASNRESRSSMFQEQLSDLILYCWKSVNEMPNMPEFKSCLTQSSSFAGAIGMPQFMPTSIRKFAKDGNGDGKIDLRNSPEDAMQSIANFMLGHGWKPGEPIYLPIPESMQASDIVKQYADGDPNPKWTLAQLRDQGIIKAWPRSLNDTSPALIVDLPGIDSSGKEYIQYVVGLKNFEVITQYNRSFFYAMSVTEFGQAVVADTSATTSGSKQGKPRSTNSGHHGHKR